MTRARGTNARFMHTIRTDAGPDEIWNLWTDASRWRAWDGGLRRASLPGGFVPGEKGSITPLKGPDATFTVTSVEQLRACTYETTLPLARLRVRRVLEPSSEQSGTAFTHHVSFHGILGWLWALMMGGRFRLELPRTMERLAAQAMSVEGSDKL